jgi:hypothetical protein
MSKWDPHIDLVQLLKALGDEIAATTEGDVVQACAEARQSVTEAAKEVRELISAVSGDPVGADTDPFDPKIALKESHIDLEGSRPHGIIAERGSRTHCRQH